jgi:hypothetical protein
LAGNGIDIGKYLSEEAKEAFKIKREITKKIWEGSGCINPKEYRKKYIKEVILGKTNKEKESRKQTKPERKVEEQLTALGIPYIREFTVLMHDYDFYLPDHNLLIEFHGKQHYEWIPYFHKTEDAFKEAQQKDKLILLSISAVWCH